MVFSKGALAVSLPCAIVVTFSLQPSPSPSMLRQLEQQQQAGPSSPHSIASTATTPRTPKPQPSSSADTSSKFAPAEGGNFSCPAAPTPDPLQPQSSPTMPATVDSTGLPEGRAAWHSPGLGPAQTRMPAAASPSLEMSPDPRQKHERLTGLPSAEDIDALCDMDTPSHHAIGTIRHPQDNRMCPPMYPALAPVLTHSSAAGGLADNRPSKPGSVPGLYPHDSSTPQHSSSSQFKHSLSRQPFPPSSRPEVPESSVPCSHSCRLQSECDSSAYDEAASSTLIHSISNEEQSMHDLLGDDNDDMLYIVTDTQQQEPQAGMDRHRMPQLNTMELHGLLGQHGYKLPELAGDQEDEEESDGDDGGGDGDEDLDDPDVDDEDDDEDANKAIYKVGGRSSSWSSLRVFISVGCWPWQQCCTYCKAECSVGDCLKNVQVEYQLHLLSWNSFS